MPGKTSSAPPPSGAVTFTAVLREGHKGTAIEVPFDPDERWGKATSLLRPGRHGHWVRGSLGGVPFTSTIVPRSGRFWLLVDDSLRRAAKVRVGDTVEVTIEAPEE